MVSIDSDQRSAPRRFAASPALHAPTHLDTLVEPDWLTVPILSLLRQFLGSIGVLNLLGRPCGAGWVNKEIMFKAPPLLIPTTKSRWKYFWIFWMQPSKAVSIIASRSWFSSVEQRMTAC